jgi:putative oxidoreductase
MAQSGARTPLISALVAIAVECIGSVAIVLAVWTRPLAVLMVSTHSLPDSLGITSGRCQVPTSNAKEINFYKNVSITGGFLALYVGHAAKYSLHARLGAGADRWSPIYVR